MESLLDEEIYTMLGLFSDSRNSQSHHPDIKSPYSAMPQWSRAAFTLSLISLPGLK
jgi:hypothetical protein